MTENERFEAACDGCGLVKLVEWDGERGLCDTCRREGVDHA